MTPALCIRISSRFSADKNWSALDLMVFKSERSRGRKTSFPLLCTLSGEALMESIAFAAFSLDRAAI